MDPLALLASVAAGAAVVLVAIALAGGERRASATTRLDQYRAATQDALAKLDAERTQRGVASHSFILSTLNRLVERRSFADDIARELARADLALRPIEYIGFRVAVIAAFVAMSFAFGAMLFPALGHPLSLAVSGVIGYILPRVWIARRKGARINAFNAGLADTVTLIANSLRAGSSFLQSIELAVRETQPPVSTEFQRVVREVSLGLSLEQALNNMVRRVRSDDLELLATAVTIQYQVGGNLADILDAIAFTIRDRVRIKGEIRTLTAQQRLSGYIVASLPIFLLIVLMVLSPRFINPMFESPPEFLGLPLGISLLMLGATMMAFGFYVVRRIVDIEV